MDCLSTVLAAPCDFVPGLYSPPRYHRDEPQKPEGLLSPVFPSVPSPAFFKREFLIVHGGSWVAVLSSEDRLPEQNQAVLKPCVLVSLKPCHIVEIFRR